MNCRILVNVLYPNMFSGIRVCRYFAPSAACLVRQLVLSRRGRSLVVSAMIRLMHQLASAKQAASGRPQLGNAAHAASPPEDCASTDLVGAVYRSEVTYLTLCS